ncbi:hypothetical protein CASFOL_008427 [Castilleja foliolosa]|uniref:KIB1-4 beta-propeller domain-containing protein n=1 Tax=Castilleja foliolosa TaxID=1961234 RepID=A0ABD3DZZ1_9LAMI
MASTIFSSSSPISLGLVPTSKSPNSARMMSIPTVSCLKIRSPHGLKIPLPCPMLPPTLEVCNDMVNNLFNFPQNKVGLKIPSPCLMLPPTFEGGGDMVCNMYNLAQNKVVKFNNKKLIPDEGTRIVGSSHGWLALFNERNGDLNLINPVTRSHVKLPPSRSHLKLQPSRSFKVIISCDAEQEDCRAMMIYDYGRLAFCCPGSSTTEWTPLGAELERNKYPRSYEDIVYSRRHNLFFCVTMTTAGDDFEAWDLASDPPRLRWENRHDLMDYYQDWFSQSVRLLLDKTDIFCEYYKYLVFAEQTDQLFYVTRHIVLQMAPDGSAVENLYDKSYPYKTVFFDVHKVDWELGGDGGRISLLDGGSLDGLAMFVGRNHSFAVLATEANGLKPNSIYFTDEKMVTPSPKRDVTYGGHDIGIFDYENKTISSCYYPCDLHNFKRITPEPIWFTPTVH